MNDGREAPLITLTLGTQYKLLISGCVELKELSPCIISRGIYVYGVLAAVMPVPLRRPDQCRSFVDSLEVLAVTRQELIHLAINFEQFPYRYLHPDDCDRVMSVSPEYDPTVIRDHWVSSLGTCKLYTKKPHRSEASVL